MQKEKYCKKIKKDKKRKDQKRVNYAHLAIATVKLKTYAVRKGKEYTLTNGEKNKKMLPRISEILKKKKNK